MKQLFEALLGPQLVGWFLDIFWGSAAGVALILAIGGLLVMADSIWNVIFEMVRR